jgi:hypothetical protein
MKPHIFHVKDGTVKCWIIGDARHVIRGKASETMMAVVGIWEKAHGQPADGYIRVQGYCRMTEAVAQLTSMAMEGGAA